MPHREHDEQLLEVAERIGRKQRDREIRLVLLSSLVTLAVIFLFGTIASCQMNEVLTEIKDQNEELDQEFDNNRVAQALEAERLQTLLQKIDDNLISQGDFDTLSDEVEQLQADVKDLSEEVRGLRRSNEALVRAIRRLSAGGG